MSAATILVADDDRAIRTVLNQALGRLGYEVRTTGTAATLWQWVDDGVGDLVITDVVMPDENGLDLVPRIRKRRPDLRVIVMSAQNTLLTAVRANERGAFDYLPKPFDLNELIGIVEKALTQPHAVLNNGETRVDEERLPLIGRSPAMQDIYRVLARLMQTDLTVMITGESGTGKELVARALHDYGKRRNGPFVAINMAAIPRELIESELFGHEKGAFTGALARGVGRFEQAAAGTLFLDEIGDMPPEAQTRLLRVLQEGEYTSVGGRTPMRANVRIVAATHRDLQAADPARPVPRGPLLPPECRAAPAAAAARADRGHPGPRPPLPRGRPRRGAGRQVARPRRPRLPDALQLAGQRARAGKPGPAARGPQQRRGHPCRCRRRRAVAHGGRGRALDRRLPGNGRRTASPGATSPPTAAACRRAASMTGFCARSSGR